MIEDIEISNREVCRARNRLTRIGINMVETRAEGLVKVKVEGELKRPRSSYSGINSTIRPETSRKEVGSTAPISKIKTWPVCWTMKRRPLPSAGELTSSGAVKPLAKVESLSATDAFRMSGTGGVGVGVGSARDSPVAKETEQTA